MEPALRSRRPYVVIATAVAVTLVSVAYRSSSAALALVALPDGVQPADDVCELASDAMGGRGRGSADNDSVQATIVVLRSSERVTATPTLGECGG